MSAPHLGADESQKKDWWNDMAARPISRVKRRPPKARGEHQRGAIAAQLHLWLPATTGVLRVISISLMYILCGYPGARPDPIDLSMALKQAYRGPDQRLGRQLQHAQ